MPQPVATTELNINDQHKLLGLDHLRAVAIIAVFLFHYHFFGHPDWVGDAFVFGWTGVDLFFVLSGFLIAGQLFATVVKGKQIPVKEFFIKRFFRIIPPYFIVILIYALLPDVKEWGNLSPLWRYFTFTLNFGLDLKKYGTFSHAWSLCVEEQFYLVLPLMFLFFNYFKAGKASAYVLAGLFFAGFLIRYLCWHYQIEPNLSPENMRPVWNYYVYYPTYNRLDGLLVGVSIAGLFIFYPKVKQLADKYSYLMMPTGILMLAGGYFVCIPKEGFNATIYGFPLISVAFGMILAAAVSPLNSLFRLKSRVTSLIATLSYSIYLVHKFVIHLTQIFFEKHGVDKNSVLMLLICMATTVLAALLMRYAVEKPALLIRNKILGRMKR